MKKNVENNMIIHNFENHYEKLHQFEHHSSSPTKKKLNVKK